MLGNYQFNFAGAASAPVVCDGLKAEGQKKPSTLTRSDFLKMVSHDLQTPLTSINLIFSMLAEGKLGKLDEQGYDVVVRAKASTEYLIKMVGDILDSEKIESGNVDIAVQIATLKDIINQALDATLEESRSRRIVVLADAGAGYLLADQDRLAQVLINLISNALKHSKPNSKVIVKARIENMVAIFNVIDSGEGIPEEFRKSIFKPYVQLEQPKMVKRRGFGLGLAICKTLVEAHQGDIWVEPAEGQGCNFTFTIPVACPIR